MIQNKQNSFETWNFHDAILSNIKCDWQTGNAIIALAAFLKPDEPAVSCLLIFEGVEKVVISRQMPWGPSIYINRHRIGEMGEYILEMQSGDEIHIEAEMARLEQ